MTQPCKKASVTETQTNAIKLIIRVKMMVTKTEMFYMKDWTKLIRKLRFGVFFFSTSTETFKNRSLEHKNTHLREDGAINTGDGQIKY